MKQARQFSSRWFRAYDEAVDDPKLQMLSDKAHRFLFNCWCLASKNGGYLPPVSEIAWRLRMTEAKAAALLAELHEKNLLDDEADTFTPHNWCERQFDSDVSTERVRRFRERKRNGDETFPKRRETVSETAPEQIQSRADTEESKNTAPNGALSVVPKPRYPRNTGKRRRTLEEVRRDLGIRAAWFDAVCAVHPGGKDGVKAGAEAFERRVTPDEAGHALAQEMYRGAKAYGDRCKADPTIKVKWLQGWINDERWLDENKIRAPTDQRQRSFIADVTEVIGRNIQETGKPW